MRRERKLYHVIETEAGEIRFPAIRRSLPRCAVYGVTIQVGDMVWMGEKTPGFRYLKRPDYPRAAGTVIGTYRGIWEGKSA